MVYEEISIRPLSAALRNKAEEELNETPEKIVSHLKILQDWIKTQPHLNRVKQSNQWLIAFLRGCKYDIEKAKKKIDAYYTNRATIAELYENRDPFDPNIQKTLELGVFLPLRKTLQDDDARICIARPGVFSDSKLPLTDLLKVAFMIMEILLMEDDHFTIGGEISNMVQEDDISIRPLSAALRKKAEEELNETPEKIVSHLKILQDWIKTQPHLHKINARNQWLVAFLRGCKYDIEKAKKKINVYYTNKATITELYWNRDPFDPSIQKILELGIFLPVQKTSKDDDARMCLSRPGVFSDLKLPLTDLIKVSLMIIEILLIEDDNFTIGGEEVITDLEGMPFGFLFQWTPSLAKKIMTSVEKALSIRLKCLHVLNPLYGLSTAVTIFKMFLSSKMKNRIFIHNKDTLYEHVSRSILPVEYGGTEGTVQELTDYWKEKVESYREWFIDENSSSDETKRPKPAGWGIF